MVNPKPVPPKFLTLLSWACEKLSKIAFNFSFLIPIPVSVTSKSNTKWSFVCSLILIPSEILPFSVNLNAFSNRLMSI